MIGGGDAAGVDNIILSLRLLLVLFVSDELVPAKRLEAKQRSGYQLGVSVTRLFFTSRSALSKKFLSTWDEWEVNLKR